MWLSRQEFDERNHHFLQRNATMLEGVLVIIDIVGVVVRVGEKGIPGGENERGGEVLFGQKDGFRTFYLINVL